MKALRGFYRVQADLLIEDWVSIEVLLTKVILKHPIEQDWEECKSYVEHHQKISTINRLKKEKQEQTERKTDVKFMYVNPATVTRYKHRQ